MTSQMQRVIKVRRRRLENSKPKSYSPKLHSAADASCMYPDDSDLQHSLATRHCNNGLQDISSTHGSDVSSPRVPERINIFISSFSATQNVVYFFKRHIILVMLLTIEIIIYKCFIGEILYLCNTRLCVFGMFIPLSK